MNCPKCGGEMWNNIGRKRNPKAPDYKCKDKDCDGAVWPPKQKASTVSGGGVDVKLEVLKASCAIAAATAKEKPYKTAIDGFKVLLKAYKEPFGPPPKANPPYMPENAPPEEEIPF